MLADAASKARQAGRKRFAPVDEPWPDFLDNVRTAIEGVVVSHRVNHKINGPLHEETNYSKAHKAKVKGKTVEVRHVRKPLAMLSSNEVDQIVDDRVRDLVKAKLNGGDPKKVFADAANFPAFHTRKGDVVPIKKTRIQKSVNTIAVGTKRSPRYVAPGSNHHMAIVATLNQAGEETKWEGHLVSRFEAMQRLRRGEPVVQRDWGADRRFKFTLAGGDMIRITQPDKPEAIYVIRGISQNQKGAVRIDFAHINDARMKKDIIAAKDWGIITTMDHLRTRNADKVSVSPLGEVRPCHD